MGEFMLVSLMARLNAVTQRNNAQYAMMCNNMNMMNLLRSPSFGNMSMDDLHRADMNFALSNDYYQTQYLLASAQEKAAAQLMAQEAKNNKISYIA